MKTIVDHLAKQRKRFTPIIKKFLSKQRDKYSSLTSDYAVLLDHLHDYLLRGGKWHRPALALLAYQASGGKNEEEVMQAALVTEVIHRFLLIHDDIIDQDLTRHNGPTLEKIYQDYFIKNFGNRVDKFFSKGNALVAGDVVNILGSELILDSQIEAEVSLALLSGINQMILETAAGWQLQNKQNYMRIDEVSCEDFFTGMQLVSCQYSIVWPLRLGQILAGRLKVNEWDNHLDKYGWHCGAAFQIADDIMGMFGDEATTGKPSGHDFREGKKTYLVLKAYEQANLGQRKLLDQLIGKEITKSELDEIRKIMIETGSLQFSQELVKEHVQKAVRELEKVESRSKSAKELMFDFASFLTTRTY